MGRGLLIGGLAALVLAGAGCYWYNRSPGSLRNRPVMHYDGEQVIVSPTQRIIYVVVPLNVETDGSGNFARVYTSSSASGTHKDLVTMPNPHVDYGDPQNFLIVGNIKATNAAGQPQPLYRVVTQSTDPGKIIRP
ncbi:hypothetical protein J4230_03225 [Candidatus Woesearchaeota archaeon]|nr:hypothetical protein [Candidatus Woesearchaeota archaeon]